MPGGETQASSLADALKKYEDAVKALVDAWPGEKDESAEPDTTPPTDQAEKVLAWARKKYDGLVRWVLACFTAIGLLIFGSVPFVDLTAVDMKPVIIGLGLAGIGLGIVVWATTRALEPEDASLGEMKETLNLGGESDGLKRILESVVNPKRTQARRLDRVLSSDPTAHFGPGIEGQSAAVATTRLLNEIAAAETALLTLENGWRLAPSPPDLTAVSDDQLEKSLTDGIDRIKLTLAPNGGSGLSELWRLSDSDSRLAIIKQLSGDERRTAVESWHSAVVALVRALAKPDPTKSTSTQAALEKAAGGLRLAKESLAKNDHHPSPDEVGAAAKAVDDATAALNDADIHEQATARRISDQRAILNNRLTHREMLIAESGVSQLRGTFRIVRRWLFLGAVLTLTGGTLYAWAVANPTPYGLGMSITVTMPDSSKTAEKLGFCGAKEEWEQTFAAVLMSKETANPQGEFTAIATSGPCAGKIFTVSADDRATTDFVFGMPQASSSSDEGTKDDESTPAPEAKVTVTISPESSAWDTVAKTCNLSTPQKSPITLPGYVSLPAGPLTMEAPFDAKVMCPEGTQAGMLVPITLEKGEGSYTAP